ncbi:RhuM family protein [Corynebacterium pseudodiphtheriticum]|nr:RhuM family protein [Corynebacterium pseudodiphtheriticum]MDK8545219.1 RhuM family protein [Corynebacterium pseudodiphtheriticum]
MENVTYKQGRTVHRSIEHYNLDAIMAVGFRVRGPCGTQFRRWATEVSSEFLPHAVIRKPTTLVLAILKS